MPPSIRNSVPSASRRIEDTGPLTKKRMETIDDEVSDVAEAFIRKAVADGKPFFVWWNTTRMHIWTHLAPEAQGVTGVGIYPDGMVEHDADVGRMLDLLDELGVTDNTIVMYSTDNGAEEMTWPDGGTTPFRGEKNTTFDGGFRVPCLWRWPGVIEPGTISNAIGSHEDCLPTLLAAAGAAGHHPAIARRAGGRRPDLQGAHRRLQLHAVLGGRGRRAAAAGVLLLDRRR